MPKEVAVLYTCEIHETLIPFDSGYDSVQHSKLNDVKMPKRRKYANSPIRQFLDYFSMITLEPSNENGSCTRWSRSI